METTFNILQPIIAILLMVSVLLQQKGTGLGSAFGSGNGAEVYSSKRGAEKVLFRTTITLSIIFLGLGVIRLLLNF